MRNYTENCILVNKMKIEDLELGNGVRMNNDFRYVIIYRCGTTLKREWMGIESKKGLDDIYDDLEQSDNTVMYGKFERMEGE